MINTWILIFKLSEKALWLFTPWHEDVREGRTFGGGMRHWSRTHIWLPSAWEKCSHPSFCRFCFNWGLKFLFELRWGVLSALSFSKGTLRSWNQMVICLAFWVAAPFFRDILVPVYLKWSHRFTCKLHANNGGLISFHALSKCHSCRAHSSCLLQEVFSGLDTSFYSMSRSLVVIPLFRSLNLRLQAPTSKEITDCKC